MRDFKHFCRKEIIVIYPITITGRYFGFTGFWWEIHWFGGIGKLRHLEKQTGSKRINKIPQSIRIQRLPIITGRYFGFTGIWRENSFVWQDWQTPTFREANLTTRSRWETTYKFRFHGCNNRNSMGNNFLFRVSRKSLLVIWMKAFVLKFLFLPQKALSWYHIQPTIHLRGVLEMTWKSDKAKQ